MSCIVWVDADLCTLCGECVDSCPCQVLIIEGNGGMTVDEDACIGCAMCVDSCPENAIAIEC